MGSDDLTVRVLIEIRDQIGGLRDEVGGLRTEVVETNKCVDAMDQHLGTEIVAMKTVLADVARRAQAQARLICRHAAGE